MFETASEFTMKDQSSKPYAWMIENIDLADIQRVGVEKWVREYVKTYINATNYTQHGRPASDKTVYRTWRSGWEFAQIVNYINDTIANS